MPVRAVFHFTKPSSQDKQCLGSKRPQPPSEALFVAMRRLPLRAGAKLSSASCGHIPEGTSVRIVERCVLRDGTSCARLGVGVEDNPGLQLGWFTDDGVSLGQLAVGPYLDYSGFSWQDAAAGWDSPRRSDGPAPAAMAEPGAQATQAAAAGGGGSEVSSSGSSGANLLQDCNLQTATNAMRFGRRLQAMATGASSSEELLTAGELHQLGSKLKTQAQRDEIELSGMQGQLKVRLGAAVVGMNMRIKELVNVMANGTTAYNGSNTVSKTQFRRQVRSMVEQWPDDSRQIDLYFEEIDTDGGGFIDLDEMTSAMRRLKEEAKATRIEQARLNDRVSLAHTRAAEAVEAAAMTADAEAAMARLSALEAGTSDSFKTKARVGAVLLNRVVPIGDADLSESQQGWVCTNGSVNEAQFVENIRSLGVTAVMASVEELVRLFESYDTDSSQSLDLPELMEALVALREAAKEAKRMQTSAQKHADQLVRAARAAQAKFQEEVRMPTIEPSA